MVLPKSGYRKKEGENQIKQTGSYCRIFVTVSPPCFRSLGEINPFRILVLHALIVSFKTLSNMLFQKIEQDFLRDLRGPAVEVVIITVGSVGEVHGLVRNVCGVQAGR